MEKDGLYKEPSFVDSIKGRLTEVASDYFKKKFENTKEDVMKYIERTIQKKIKREIRKYTYTGISISLFLFGSLFLIYGAIATIVFLLSIPMFLTNIIFGSLLLVVGWFVYLLR